MQGWQCPFCILSLRVNDTGIIEFYFMPYNVAAAIQQINTCTPHRQIYTPKKHSRSPLAIQITQGTSYSWYSAWKTFWCLPKK